jgi:hypothetical protein
MLTRPHCGALPWKGAFVALPSNVELLFGGSPTAPKLSPTEVSLRFDELMKAVSTTRERELNRQEIAGLGKGEPLTFEGPTSAYDILSQATQNPTLTKGLSADALASVTSSLETLKSAQPELTKDLTLTTPLTTGLVAFDLEAPSFS